METEFLPADESGTGVCVVVADSVRARLFESHRRAPGLRPLIPYDLTVTRLRDSERWSDRAGTSHQRVGFGVHSMQASTSPSEHQAELLAREIADVLHHARTSDRIHAIVVIAPPAFLGLLRKAIDGPTAALILAEDARDLASLAEHELEARIPAAAWRGHEPPPRRAQS